MNRLEELIARVEGLTGPCGLIDAELYATWGGAPHTTEAGGRTIPLIEIGDPSTWPAYTKSLDAAMGLTERVMPGTEIELTNIYGVARATVGLNRQEGPTYGENKSGILSLALVLATLKALAAREEDHG